MSSYTLLRPGHDFSHPVTANLVSRHILGELISFFDTSVNSLFAGPMAGSLGKMAYLRTKIKLIRHEVPTDIQPKQ